VFFEPKLQPDTQSPQPVQPLWAMPALLARSSKLTVSGGRRNRAPGIARADSDSASSLRGVRPAGSGDGCSMATARS
jgi:hypothetical protein